MPVAELISFIIIYAFFAAIIAIVYAFDTANESTMKEIESGDFNLFDDANHKIILNKEFIEDLKQD